MPHKKRLAAAIFVCLLLFLVVLMRPTLLSAKNVEEAKKFCGSIEARASSSKIEELAKSFSNRPIKLHMYEQRRMAQIGVCHCWIDFEENKTIVSKVVCNG